MTAHLNENTVAHLTSRKGSRQVYKYYILARSRLLSGARHVASGCDRGYAKISDRNYAKSPARGATGCVRFGAESWGVMERAGEDVFFFRRCREEREEEEDEDGEERGRKLGKRVRACTTLYSLVSEFRRQHVAT